MKIFEVRRISIFDCTIQSSDLDYYNSTECDELSIEALPGFAIEDIVDVVVAGIAH